MQQGNDKKKLETSQNAHKTHLHVSLQKISFDSTDMFQKRPTSFTVITYTQRNRDNLDKIAPYSKRYRTLKGKSCIFSKQFKSRF